MRTHRIAILVGVIAALSLPAAGARSAASQADQVAAKLVEHFRTSSCETLAKERRAPKSIVRTRMIKNAGARLRQDAQLRAEFLAKVAVPVADKMIVCGFIP
jgi:hypothetical protein